MTALYAYCDSVKQHFFMGADDFKKNEPSTKCKKITSINDRYLVGVFGNDCPDIVLSVMAESNQKFDFDEIAKLAGYISRETRVFAKHLFPMYYINLMEEKHNGLEVSLKCFFEDSSAIVIVDMIKNKIAKYELGKPLCKVGYIGNPSPQFLFPDQIYFFSYAAAFEEKQFRKATPSEESDLIQFLKDHVECVRFKYPENVGSLGGHFLKNGDIIVASDMKYSKGTLTDSNFNLLDYFVTTATTEGEVLAEGPKTELWEDEPHGRK